MRRQVNYQSPSSPPSQGATNISLILMNKLSLIWICIMGAYAWIIGHILVYVLYPRLKWGIDEYVSPCLPFYPGGGFVQQSRFCAQSKKAVAHCLCEHGRPRGGGSYNFVLLEEDRWFCVWPSPRKCILMSVQAAVMASGYSRDEGYRQQVLAAIGQT